MNSPRNKPPKLTLDAIDTGLALVEEKASPDVQDVLERKEIELEALRLRNKLARSTIKSARADRRMRKQYASRILRYLECYSVGVAILVLLSGFRLFKFTLEQGVLTALVGSTAVAAIGLVGFIARGLFRPPTADLEFAQKIKKKGKSRLPKVG